MKTIDSPSPRLTSEPPPLRVCLLAAVILLVLHCQTQKGLVAAEPPPAQTIQLNAGWNLLSFQVLPTDPSPQSVFGSLGTDFSAVWTFDNQLRRWTMYAREGLPEAEGMSVMPLSRLDIGKAYWVYMATARTWRLDGLPPTTVPAVDLTQGWNLIGVPTGTATLSESVSIGAVLAAAGLDYDTILRWEITQYGKFTPVDTDVDDFTAFDPSRGYWVNVKSEAFRLQPRLLASVRADVDVEPQGPGNYPSFEDLVISASSVPLSATNQTHIVFLPGEDTQQLALANTGGGILLWRLEWAADSDSAPTVEWLQVSAVQGVTTIENDVVNLYLDRTGLVQGIYRGTLRLVTTAGSREFRVVAHVPGLAGEWRGQAISQSVNGRRNPLPEVDLHLSFYEDPEVPGLIRGFIDSRNALLWPVDVPMVGHILDASGNAFSLNGGYVLPPGDQNNPPYNQFNNTGEDVDWNCDGRLDDLNPYPFPLYRSVTLNGRLTQGSPISGYEIAGQYTEVVYGLLRQPIRVEGIFSIRRENPQPFSNRRPSLNAPETGTQPVVLKGLAAPVLVPAGRSTNTLAFTTDMVLLDLAVELDLDSPLGTDIRATLVAPDGKQARLHDRMAISSLRRLVFPASRRPADSFATAFINAGASTKGDWKLVIENSGTAARMTWSLRLHGQPVFDLTGRVTDSLGRPLPAQISLNGLTIGEVVQAGADGTFLFRRLPGIPLNLSSLLNGYLPIDPTMPGLDARFTLPQFPATCNTPDKLALAAQFRPLPVMAFPPFATSGFDPALGTTAKPVELQLIRDPAFTGTTPVLRAIPVWGPAPLDVTFLVDNAPTSSLIWRMGDGSQPEFLNQITRRYVYSTSKNDGYRVEVSGDGVEFRAETTVYPMPSPGHSPYAFNFFQVFFTGGGSVPPDLIIPPPAEPNQPPLKANLLTVQHAYAASFDLDLAPHAQPETSFFDDHFDPNNEFTGANGHSANRQKGFKDEDHNYQVAQGDQLGQWSLAGECGYAVDDDFFHPHPKRGATGECKELPRYRIACNIGPQLLPNTPAEVFAVPEIGPPDPTPRPPQPGFGTGFGASGLAQNRSFRLVTGPLAALYVRGGTQ